MPENKDVCRLSLWLRRMSVFLQALQRLGIVCIQTYRGTTDSTSPAQRAEPETRNISTSGKTNLGYTTICPGLEGQGVEGEGEGGIFHHNTSCLLNISFNAKGEGEGVTGKRGGERDRKGGGEKKEMFCIFQGYQWTGGGSGGWGVWGVVEEIQQEREREYHFQTE